MIHGPQLAVLHAQDKVDQARCRRALPKARSAVHVSAHPDGHWRRGFLLALSTAALWGVLPIALKIVLEGMDGYTITWCRFVIAAIGLIVFLLLTRGIPKLSSIGRDSWRLLVVACLGLTANYVLCIWGLFHTSPTVMQIVCQFGPFFLLIGGLMIFKERLSWLQTLGLTLLVVGLLVFFNRSLATLVDFSTDLGLGVALLVLASVGWAFYGLAQKQLSGRLRSQQILAFIYVGAVAVLAPVASPSKLGNLNALQLWALLFCGINTLLAYGAFAEAVKHWAVTRVGAVLALTPLFTLISMMLAERWIPHLVRPEDLNGIAVFGALIVVAGSMLCALGRAPATAPSDGA